MLLIGPSSRRSLTTTASIRTPKTKSTCSTTGVRFASGSGWFSASLRWSRCWRSCTSRANPIFSKRRREFRSILKMPAPFVNKSRPLYGPTDDPIYFNTQLQILVSPGLMRRVVRTLDLEHNPDFFKGNPAQRQSTWQTLRRMVGLGQSAAGGRIEGAGSIATHDQRRAGNSTRRSKRSEAPRAVRQHDPQWSQS